MQDVIIENPILNSPYKEPSRHFRFSDEGITNEIIEGRRVPAINNHGGFGRWAFMEITDPWNAKNEIRGALESDQEKRS